MSNTTLNYIRTNTRASLHGQVIGIVSKITDNEYRNLLVIHPTIFVMRIARKVSELDWKFDYLDQHDDLVGQIFVNSLYIGHYYNKPENKLCIIHNIMKTSIVYWD